MIITVNASDPDGYVRKVEYYNGWHKLGESTAPPFTFTWHTNMSGPYDISVVAIDNKGARTRASLVTGLGRAADNCQEFRLYPVPGNNELTLEFNLDFPAEAILEIFDTAGKLIFTESYIGLAPGSHVITINPGSRNGMLQGTYLCKLTATSGSNFFKAARLFVMY
jgi:hypothetical protein